MIEFGSTLRAARERKGLTTKQVAEATHMMVQMVEDLEEERFTLIAAPIYGRGFVKLYCEAVGLDPKPLIAEFMDIFNGNRTPTIRRRDTAPAAAAPVAAETPESGPAEAPEADVAGSDDGIIAAALETTPAPVAAPEPPMPAPEESLFSFAQSAPAAAAAVPAPAERAPIPATSPRGPSRFAAPTPIDDAPGAPRFTVPPVVYRFLALAVAAALVLGLLYAGFSALASALRAKPAPVETPAVETAAETSKSGTAATDAKPPRKPMAIPPLYID